MAEQPTLPGIDMSLDAYVADAIRLLQMMQPKDKPYYGCFSGGKDSCVIKELARLAEVNVEWHYNVTTIDPPELVRFIRREHPDVKWEKPERGFFTWFRTQGFPTRRQRWCCRLLKETRTPQDSVMIFGVRAEESPRRAKNWRPVTAHTHTHTYVVSPVVRWTSEQVWAFIRERGLEYCELYDEGFDRLGCVGCPMGGCNQQKRQFARWPKYLAAWRNAFKSLWERKRAGNQRWMPQFESWEELWQWWLSDEPLPTVEEQCQGFVELFS